MSTDEKNAAPEAAERTPPIKAIRDFLESTPPNVIVRVPALFQGEDGGQFRYDFPAIELYCKSPECAGARLHGPAENYYLPGQQIAEDIFVRYVCRNCRKSTKTFALRVRLDIVLRNDPKSARPGRAVALGMSYDPRQRHANIFKLGEDPPFGPHVPSRLIALVETERDLFLKGRQAESVGLGIGAFSYYRRVVENQFQRVIGEIISVAVRIGADKDMISDLELARSEKQFSNAVRHVKHGIPASLLLDGGHNPLTLLHDSLSNGLHAETDEECLEIAESIRLLLEHLSDRLDQALKDHKVLNDAVSKLLQRKTARTAPQERKA
jgi:hypothetical protein